MFVNNLTLINVTKSNSSDTENFSLFPISDSLKFVFSTMYYSISLLSVFGNLLIVFAVIRNRRMHNVTNFFIVNLALADIIISLFATPFQFHAAILQRWVWPAFLCKLAPFALNLNISVSVFTLVAISIDRFYVIIFPLKPKLRKKGCYCIIFSIWMVGFLLSGYSLYNYELESNGDGNYRCGYAEDQYLKIQLIMNTVFQFLIPLLIITITATLIYRRIYYENTPFSPTTTQAKNKRKVIKMIFLVACMFTVCWTPIQAYQIAQLVSSNINNFYYINVFWLTANWLAMSNSSYNVIIYGACSTRYKNEFQKILCCDLKGTKSKYYNKVELSCANSNRYDAEFANLNNTKNSNINTKTYSVF